VNVNENGNIPFITKGINYPDTPEKYVFKFQIKEKLEQGKIEITLKHKLNTTDCTLNGYKCCTDVNAKIVYQD